MLRLMPLLVGLGLLCAVISVRAEFTVSQRHAESYVNYNRRYQRYEFVPLPEAPHLVGECAAGVQKVFADANGGNWNVLKQTRYWRRGRKVLGNSIPTGTAIASFGDNGCYDNNHAAIYKSQSGGRITVWDQYNNPRKGWSLRELRSTRYGDKSNNPNYFYVIEHRNTRCQ